MYPEGYYVMTGASTARDLFFETNQDIIDFKELFERMLGEYLEVNRMLLYKDRWYIAIKLHSEDKIRQQYLSDRDKSKKANRENDHLEPWRMISERMRLFLCNFVVNTNNRKNRKGGKVNASYQRYFFMSIEEMEREMKNWEERAIPSSQKSALYKYSDKYYKVQETKGGISRLIFCKREEFEGFCSINKHKIWKSMLISVDVVGNWIKSTKKLHTPPT